MTVVIFYQQVIRFNNKMSERNLNRPTQYTRKKIENFSYGLNDQIGKGYSSQVYRGRNDDTDTPVAVKVIDLKMLKSDINRTLLASQIQILKKMKSFPHILTLHEVYTTKNNTYIITQLCESDLSKKIKKRLSERQACVYMKQLISGYAFIHSNEIIHRDLKPANLLLTHQGNLKVADFGFGISAEEVTKPSKYNVGSPLYMAPESLKRNQYSFKTDLWAIGVIFYEMLTSQTPWRAKNEKQLLKKIEAQKIQSILAKKEFHPLIKKFLTKILEYDKNQRMTPEELLVFDFSPIVGVSSEESILNVPSQKKLNLTFKYETLVSEVNTPQRSKEQFHLTSEKSQKRILNPLKSVNIQLQPVSQNNSTYNLGLKKTESDDNRNHLVTQNKQQKDFTTNNNTSTQGGLKKQQKKNVSKILIAEVHFCRFLYKLLMRIKESIESGILGSIQESSQVRNIFLSYTRLIKYKLEKIINFSQNNFLRIKEENHIQYQQTSDFKKLLKISKEYTERYSKQLAIYWSAELSKNNSSFYDKDLELYINLLDTKPTNMLMLVLKQRLEASIGQFADPFSTSPFTHQRKTSQHDQIESERKYKAIIEKNSKDIIILDYLMTARQLLDILRQSPSDLEKFAKKSRIQEIVQGATANIDYSLYRKINERSTLLLQNNFQKRAGILTQNEMNACANQRNARCSKSISLGMNQVDIENQFR